MLENAKPNHQGSNQDVNQDPNHPAIKFFDLHVTGIGYLNRVREVPVRRFQPFLAVDISALHGDSEEVQYTRFDCRVSGSDAKRIIEQLKPLIDNSQNKVLVGFRLGDLYADTFTYTSGDKAGQTGVSLKARLLRIDWVKVNGQPFEIELRPAV
jgi:CRISPR/Cas system-associated endoribonuclease Cas2